jgi:thioester reductase-like protein
VELIILTTYIAIARNTKVRLQLENRLSADYILVTGATGLLGRYLLRDLLAKGRRVAIILRPSKKQSVAQRAEEILQFWEAQAQTPLPRPVVLQGDICEDNLGLSPTDQAWVAAHCTSILHSAASLVFHKDAAGEPERSNIGGVTNMLKLCEQVGITEVHYISTAYVAGLREDVVYEADLVAGQIFRNDYEESKYNAELLVRNADFITDLTVYRPAVIAGDSRTGYTNTYHGLYMYLKLMSVLVRNTEPGPDGVRDTPVQFDMTGDEDRNIVTVDWVSEVICHLVTSQEAHGRTYHLAPEVPLTPRRIIEAGYRYFNSRGVTFAGFNNAEREPISEIDRNAHSNMGMYKEYEYCDPKFDLSNLQTYAADIPCPVIDEPMLHQFLKYGEEDRWGKRKVTYVANYACISQHCEALIAESTTQSSSAPFNVNLRVFGTGGADLILTIQSGVLVGVERGASERVAAHMEMNSEDFWWFNQPSDEFPWERLKNCLSSLADNEEMVLRQVGEALFDVSPNAKPATTPSDRTNASLV